MMATEWQWQLVLWVDGISCVACMFILLMVWYHIQIVQLSFSTNLIGHFSTLGIISFTLSAMFKTWREITYTMPSIELYHTIIISAVYSLTWSLGQIFVYLLFIERLKYSFKNTKYASSKRYFYPFYIGIGLFLIISIVAQIIQILYKSHAINRVFYSDSGDARNLAQCIIDVILSIGLLYVFIKKLSDLNKDLSVFNADEVYQGSDKSSISLNSRQEAVIKIVSKLTIITCFAVGSTQILMIYSTITFLICNGPIDCEFGMGHNYLKTITEGLWGLDCFINCLCIYLSFGFEHSYNMYYSICGCCDRLCIKCCKSMSERKLAKERNGHLKVSLLSADDINL